MLSMSFLSARSRALTVVLAVCTFAGGALSAAQSEHNLFWFNGTTEGSSPRAGLIADSSGALYGTTTWGGDAGPNSYGGTVYKMMPPSAPGGQWTQSILYSFQGNATNTDGANPLCTLVFDSSGALYGTTEHGGLYGSGTVFQLVPPSTPDGPWTENVIYSMEGTPFAGLAIDAAGALYGAQFYGQLFQLVPPAVPGGTWTYNALPILGSSTYLVSSMIWSKGNLYGTAEQGGRYGAGLVFGLKPPATPGDSWSEINIYNFKGGSDGFTPMSSLTVRSGVFYGTTAGGGAFENGTVYSLTPPATPDSPWTKTVLYSFLGGSDGGGPEGGVVFGNGGKLYGTTYAGAAEAMGTVFELTPPAAPGDPWTETTIHTFTGKNHDGGHPEDSLLLLHGAFYGTTDNPGTVFEVSP
jgi:uncharacterized repeat protein (TIGR03803 family)